MSTVPPIVGVLVAYPLWRRREMIFGNLAGTAVILGTAFALILRESIEIEQVTRACFEAGYTCWPVPSAFATAPTRPSGADGWAAIDQIGSSGPGIATTRAERNVRHDSNHRRHSDRARPHRSRLGRLHVHH